MSLVELMVALVISLFLSAGIFTMFSMSSSNVTTTTQFNQLQENGRIALAIMARDISQLGFMGDITGTDFIVGTNTTVDNPISGTDCKAEGTKAGLNNSTLPNNQPAHFRRLWGYEKTGSSGTLSCLSSSNVIDSTDVLQIKRLVGPSVGPGDGTVASIGDNKHYFVSTTSSQAIFFNGISPSSNLANSRVWEYQHRIYFVAEDDTVPSLKRKSLAKTGMGNDEQLVEGIENIRFLYGFDNDGDSVPDQYLPESSVTSLMWDNETFQRIVAIKIFILVRSVQEDKSYKNEVTYQLGDKEIKAKNDHYRRKVMSTTVVLENPVLIRS